MGNEELIKQVTEKAEKWLTPAYDAETQAEVKRMLENEDKTELIEGLLQRSRVWYGRTPWDHGRRYQSYEHLYCRSCYPGTL